MPKFSWIAIDETGDSVKGVVSAESPATASSLLRSRSLEVIQLQPKKSVLQFEITRKKVPRKDIMHFSRQLGAFLRAGIPVLEAIEVIREETTNKLFAKALEDMAQSLRAGDTFADTAAQHPESFPPFYIGILRSAEMSGNLDTVLDQLSEYIERDLEAKRKIVSALVYPGVVMAMSIVTVVVLTIYVLPKFKTFFKSLDAKLPLTTRMLISTSNFLQNFWFLFAGAGLLAIFLIALSIRTRKGRELRDRLVLRLPVLAELVRFAILERFCRILASMVTAGVPLPEALTVTSDATNNAVYQKALARVREAMMRGEGLAGPISATGLFPAAARQMFKVGEETGTLDKQLQTTAVYFDRELDYRIKRFTSLFEPAVILFMGLIVGFVAIALVSAMYGIFNQVKV